MRIGLLAASALVAGCLTTSMPGESFRGELEPATDSQVTLARALRSHVVELATRIGERHTRRPRALHHTSASVKVYITSGNPAPVFGASY